MTNRPASDNQYLRRGRALADERLRRRKTLTNESLRRRKLLKILLPLVTLSVITAGLTMVSLDTDYFENEGVIDGLHIALPADMNDFPSELVPKP